MNLVRREPVALTGLVAAIVQVAVAYGLIDKGHKELIVSAGVALVTLIAAFVARSQVTPAAPPPRG